MTGFRLSVVIPAWNATETIGAAIQSVLAQETQAHEILVVDDGSTDDLPQALAPFRDRIRYLHQANAGAAAARNKAIDSATGNWIGFLDADDTWSPQRLTHHAGVVAKHPEVEFLLGRYRRLDAQGRQLPQGGPPIGHCDQPLRLTGEPAYHLAMRTWTGVVSIRRSFLGDRRFRTDLSTAEDRDLWWHLIRTGVTWSCSAPMATYATRPGSLSQADVPQDFANMLRLFELHAGELPPAALRREVARTYGRWAGVLLAAGDRPAARRPAYQQLIRRPTSAQAWWTMLRSCLPV